MTDSVYIKEKRFMYKELGFHPLEQRVGAASFSKSIAILVVWVIEKLKLSVRKPKSRLIRLPYKPSVMPAGLFDHI